jgi:hypothetical protein
MAKFKFIKDYDAEFETGKGTLGVQSFKVGDVIEGGNNPYDTNQYIMQPPISTTLQGKMPNWDMEGQVWISIPFDVIEEVSADTPIKVGNDIIRPDLDEFMIPKTDDKKPLTNTQKWMILIGITTVAYYILYKVNKN